MSITAFGICALFLISTISALPKPSGIVFSAIIENKQYAPIQCTVAWETSTSNHLVNPDVITIDSMQSEIVSQKSVDMGDWQASAFIKSIKCGDLVLSAPFEGAGIELLWKFSVESNEILSVGTSLSNP